MAIDWAKAVSPDEATIETLALAAIEALPTPYRDAARAVLLTDRGPARRCDAG